MVELNNNEWITLELFYKKSEEPIGDIYCRNELMYSEPGEVVKVLNHLEEEGLIKKNDRQLYVITALGKHQIENKNT